MFLCNLKAQNLQMADTFVYTINLDLSQNLYLKTIPVDLLKGYCKGNWRAYYPKQEMNECLYDDFLHRFNAYQVNIPSNTCMVDYCDNAYFDILNNQFARKLKYKEVVYFDMQHSIIKRTVLWLQVFFSIQEDDIWKHFEGPVFWLFEINKSFEKITVVNKTYRNDAWTLDKTFNHQEFIVNENIQKQQQQKIKKVLQTEEY